SLASGERPEKSLHNLKCKDNVLANRKVRNNSISLPILRKIADAELHCVQRLGDFDILAVHFYRAAGNFVSRINCTDALAAARAKEAGKAVDLSFSDNEIEGADPGRARQRFGLEYGYAGILLVRILILDLGNLLEFLAHHL